MSRFTHNICAPCWNEKFPETKMRPEDMGQGIDGFCCWCEKANSDGIFLRADPATTRCDSNNDDDHLPQRRRAN